MKRKKLTSTAMVNGLFILLFLVLTAIGIMTAHTSMNNSIRNTRSSVSADMEKLVDNMQADIVRMNEAVRIVYLSQDVNWVATNPGLYYMDYDLASALNRIQGQKSSLESISSFVSEVRIMIPSVGLVFRSSHGNVGNYYHESAGDIDAYSKKITYGRFFVENGDLILGYPFFVAGKKTVFTILVYVNPQKLADALDSAIVGVPSYYRFSCCDGQSILTNCPDDVELQSGKYITETLKDMIPGLDYTVYIPKDAFETNYRMFVLYTILVSALFSVCVAGYFLLTRRILKKPIGQLIGGFTELEKENFIILPDETGTRDFRTITLAFNHMSVRLKTLIELTYKQKLLLSESELKQLQAQIDPHFLYNTFFMINAILASGDIERAEEITRKLGQYYMYITRNASSEVRLADENMHARNYCDIQSARFEDRIATCYAPLPNEMADFVVPRLIIQPILENAYSHGLKNKVRNGIVTVRFESIDSFFCIFVEDNGEDLTDGQLDEMKRSLAYGDCDSREITATINIHRRLQLRFGEESGLIFSRSILGGLCAEIHMKGGSALNV